MSTERAFEIARRDMLRRLASGGAALGLLASGSAAAQGALALHALLAQPDAGSERGARERAVLLQLYPPASEQILWVDANGRPTPAAMQAQTLLADADSDGLTPADYGIEALTVAAARLDTAEAPAEAAAAAFDLQMSLAMWHFLHDLSQGRVDPAAIGFRMSSRGDALDLAAQLRTAALQQTVDELVRSARPALAQYAQLREALATYRGLASNPALHQSLPSLATALRPGEPYADLPALRVRLLAFGDLAPGSASAPTARYEGAVVEALKRFQQRHGLGIDGVIGKATLAELNVPVAHRARQIALALERLRWLPPLGDRRLVAVNIPMFGLWTANGAAGGEAPAMRVIVGRALSAQTPPFIADMTYLVFRPYWNVPRSIVRNETLPALARDPAYLQRHDMEIVNGPGDDARPVAPTPQNVARLARGELRLRQRPGPRNSLGLVKFILPNDQAIYLHDTPAQQLFGRPRRDFSHGCVRVQDPLALAQWALDDQPQWTRERILAAMNGSQPVRVDFERPIRVLLFYSTAAVLPSDGRLHFAPDIYHYDARLEEALAKVRRP